MAYFTPFRRITAPEARPLPPIPVYEAWRAEQHPNPKGYEAPTAAQYRRLAALRRAGATVDEQARALGVSPTSTSRLYKRLPSELR